MEKIVIQQGDLILVEGELPKDAKKIRTGKRYVLLKGEGVNTHEAVGEFETYAANGVLWLVPREANLIHSEHGMTTLPKKPIYRRVEREFDYEAQEARQTRD